MTTLVRWVITTAIGIVACYAQAQNAPPYPAKPIRLIVPYPPGAGADSTARALADLLNEAFKQPVVVDNRAGAGATVGTLLVAKSPPDGYTLLCATSGGMVYGPALGMRTGYDPLKDFTPVSLVGHVAYALVTSGGLPPNNMREFLAYVKARPGAINFGSPGTGSPNHVGGVLLMKLAGLDMVHVPYKGGAAVLTDMIAGQIHMGFLSYATVHPQVQTGRVKALGVGFPKRLASLPHLPAIAETVPGFNNSGWRGLVAPANMAPEIVQRLNAAVNRALNSPAVAQRFIDSGIEPAGSTPAGLRDFIVYETQLLRKVLKDANISMNAM